MSRLGIWETVQSKFIHGTDIRTTLAFVESGEVDVGIVYQTDAAISESVKVIYQFPNSSHSPIVYPAAVMQTTNEKALAQEFLVYLSTPETTAIFEGYGFSSAESHQNVSDGFQNELEEDASERLLNVTKAEVEALILSVKVAFLSLVFILPPRTFRQLAFRKELISGKIVLQYNSDAASRAAASGERLFSIDDFQQGGPRRTRPIPAFWHRSRLFVGRCCSRNFCGFISIICTKRCDGYGRRKSEARKRGADSRGASVESVLHCDSTLIVSGNCRRRYTRFF